MNCWIRPHLKAKLPVEFFLLLLLNEPINLLYGYIYNSDVSIISKSTLFYAVNWVPNIMPKGNGLLSQNSIPFNPLNEYPSSCSFQMWTWRAKKREISPISRIWDSHFALPRTHSISRGPCSSCNHLSVTISRNNITRAAEVESRAISPLYPSFPLDPSLGPRTCVCWSQPSTLLMLLLEALVLWETEKNKVFFPVSYHLIQHFTSDHQNA